MDFQSKYDMYLRPAKNQLFIEGDKQIPCFEAPTFKARSRVQLHDTYLLAPSEEVLVPGRVKGPSTRFNHKEGMLEEANAYSQRTGAKLCKVTVIPQQGLVPVRLMNTSNEPIRVWKGATVAMMETITQAKEIEEEESDPQQEPCTCTCTCFDTSTGRAQPVQQLCCHQLARRTSLESQYEYIALHQQDEEGETCEKMENQQLPKHLQQLYNSNVGALTSTSQKRRLAKMLSDYAD